MPKRTVIDDGALQRILTAQHQVISRTQALEIGIPQSTVNTWCKAEGKWQKLLPGVYLTATGRIAMEQRQVAALLYAGPQSVITGPVAMRLHRLRCPGGDAIDVLIPWTARRQSIGFVRVHRTRRMPAFSRTGPIRFASPARAALAEVRDGIRSVAEARFRQRVRNSDLPQPRYNVFLRAADGTDIGEADAWWADAGVSAEIDSLEYHFYRDGWLKTDAKHSRMLKYGILPHHFAPTRIDNDWPAVYGNLRSSIHEGRQRPPLRIVAFEALG